MYDFTTALTTAANHLRALLAKDPTALLPRLQRRNTPTLTRPPRPWTLAIRASDTRITPYRALIDPPHAVRRQHYTTPTHCPPASAASNYVPRTLPYADPQPHRVTLTSDLLRHLCRPIRIPFPGLPHTEVAHLLGVHPNNLDRARRLRLFDVRYFKNFDARRGKPTPVLYSTRYLDPSSSNFHQMADPLWGTLHKHLHQHIPDHIEQTLTRLPRFSTLRSRGRSTPSFSAWLWQCPSCKKHVRTIYYPLPPLLHARILLPQHLLPVAHSSLPPFAPSSFACHHCHNIRFFSRINRDSWNLFISHLTSGLLFGHEVSRPSDYPSPREARRSIPTLKDAHTRLFIRKRLYKPHLHRAPSKRREQVLHLLLQNFTYLEIAAKLHIATSTVHGHIKELHRQHNVRTTKELAQKLNHPLPPHLAPKARAILHALLSGRSYTQIAQTLHTTYHSIHHHATRLYKLHNITGPRKRHQLIQLLNPPESPLLARHPAHSPGSVSDIKER